jgi:hypothetical protein
MSRPFSFLKVFNLPVKVECPTEHFVFTGNRVLERLLWEQGAVVLLTSGKFLLKRAPDLGVIFREMVGFANLEKSHSVQKKGQAETCPYPQKEGK